MIIDQIVGTEKLSYGPLDNFWYGPTAPRTLAGVDVNEQIALTLSTCWAATRLLCGTAGHLPLYLMRPTGSGGFERAADEKLYQKLHYAPNPEMSSMMFRASAVNQQVNYGNCIAEIERNGRGELENLWPIHISRVEMRLDGNNRLFYRVHNNDGSHTDLNYDDVFHVPSMMSDDGRWGKGVVRAARESIGHALATQRYGSGFFGSGGRPTGVLKHPNKMDKEARMNLRREWNEIYGGPDSPNKVAVLWEGMDYLGITTSPEDMQFIQSQQHNVEEICRWYGAPPHMVQHLLRATFNNIEHLGIDFVTYTMRPWLVLWESEIWRKLLTQEQRDAGYFAKFSAEILMRGDQATRTAASVSKFFNGEITLNEWREDDGMNPIGPLGDVHFVQAAMMPLELAVKGPQQALPAPAGSDPAPQEPEDQATPEETEEDKQQELSIHAAAVDVLADIVGVMLDKEVKEAIHAAKTPHKFLSWLDSFYDDHAGRMKQALAKPIRACVLSSRKPLIVDEMLSAAVSAHIKGSREALLEAAGGPPEGFAGAVDSCVTNWKRTEVVDLLSGVKNVERC